jgi:hypothetical protein
MRTHKSLMRISASQLVRILLAVITMLSVSTHLCSQSQKVRKFPEYIPRRPMLMGSLWTQGQYCGGAAPTEEMEDAARLPTPATGVWVYVRKGKWNNLSMPLVDSCKVDSAGKFSFWLPKGYYTLLLPVQRDSVEASHWREDDSAIRISDEACYKTWMRKGMKQVYLGNSDFLLDRQLIHRDCFLPLGLECASWNGPYPP